MKTKKALRIEADRKGIKSVTVGDLKVEVSAFAIKADAETDSVEATFTFRVDAVEIINCAHVLANLEDYAQGAVQTAETALAAISSDDAPAP